MTLSSLGFIYMILPLSVFIFYLIPTSKRTSYLVIASLVMLYGWEGSIIVLLLSTIIDYIIVKSMWSHQHNSKILKHLLIISAIKNFGVVIAVALFSVVTSTPPPIGIIVAPLSACYYHLILFKGKIAAEESMVTFFSYCLFFGKLFVGPIEKPTRLTPQLSCKSSDIDLVAEGACLVIMGVAKKVLLYDHLTSTANELTAIPTTSINF